MTPISIEREAAQKIQPFGNLRIFIQVRREVLILSKWFYLKLGMRYYLGTSEDSGVAAAQATGEVADGMRPLNHSQKNLKIDVATWRCFKRPNHRQSGYNSSRPNSQNGSIVGMLVPCGVNNQPITAYKNR